MGTPTKKGPHPLTFYCTHPGTSRCPPRTHLLHELGRDLSKAQISCLLAAYSFFSELILPATSHRLFGLCRDKTKQVGQGKAIALLLWKSATDWKGDKAQPGIYTCENRFSSPENHIALPHCSLALHLRSILFTLQAKHLSCSVMSSSHACHWDLELLRWSFVFFVLESWVFKTHNFFCWTLMFVGWMDGWICLHVCYLGIRTTQCLWLPSKLNSVREDLEIILFFTNCSNSISQWHNVLGNVHVFKWSNFYI